jgi:hypothetical protein
MLTFELAEKLREAGFSSGEDFAQAWGDNPDWTEPSLSELIEACNPKKADDFLLATHARGWSVDYYYIGYFEHLEKFKDSDGLFQVDIHVYGDTPEEAVARLWLELNKK